MNEYERELSGLDPTQILAGFLNFTTSNLRASIITGDERHDVTLKPFCTQPELAERPGLFLERVRGWSGKERWRSLTNRAFENGVPLTIFGGGDITSFNFLAEATRALMSGSGAVPKSFLPLAHVQQGLESASPMLIRLGMGMLNLSPRPLGVLGQPARSIKPMLRDSLPEDCEPLHTELVLKRALPTSGAAFDAFDHAARGDSSLLVVMADPSLPLDPNGGEHRVIEALAEWEAKLREPYAVRVILQPVPESAV